MLRKITQCTFLALALSATMPAVRAFAEEAVKEAASDTAKATKKGVRKIKDKTCKMVNGELECAAKKVKHKVENASDEAKDKAE